MRIVAHRGIDLGPDGGQQIHGQHVHGVHHENPDEHGQRHRSNELAAVGVLDVGLGLGVHHFHQDFHSRLEATRNTGSGLARTQPQNEQANETNHQRGDQRVDVDHREVNNGFLRNVLQMLQMVNDIFTCGRGMRFCGHRTTLLYINRFFEHQAAPSVQPSTFSL